jgi:hypothetical protein
MIVPFQLAFLTPKSGALPHFRALLEAPRLSSNLPAERAIKRWIVMSADVLSFYHWRIRTSMAFGDEYRIEAKITSSTEFSSQ